MKAVYQYILFFVASVAFVIGCKTANKAMDIDVSEKIDPFTIIKAKFIETIPGIVNAPIVKEYYITCAINTNSKFTFDSILVGKKFEAFFMLDKNEKEITNFSKGDTIILRAPALQNKKSIPLEMADNNAVFIAYTFKRKAALYHVTIIKKEETIYHQ